MDPNKNLEEQRRVAAEILHLSERDRPDELGIVDKAVRLAELVQALDSWLSLGGFAPSAWRKADR